MIQSIGGIAKEAVAEKMLHADTRVKGFNEAIQGIKVVKFYAWEEAFVAKVSQARDQEASALRRFAYTTAGLVSISTGAPLVALAATFLAYGIVHGKAPDTADVFTVVALFKLVVLPFRAFTEGNLVGDPMHRVNPS